MYDTVESNAAISKAIAGGKAVLVHCYGSISRSAVLIIAYIMESERLSAESATAILKEKWDAVRKSLSLLFLRSSSSSS